VNFSIVELEQLSGDKTKIYSVVMQGDDITLFDKFIRDNLLTNRDEIRFILNRLQEIGYTTGARDIYFKHNEGKPGDGVCALYDEPGRELRLFCIRYGSLAIILGVGGPKVKGIAAWQEDKKLTLEASRMIEISKAILSRIKNRDLGWSSDGKQLIGNLIFSDNENE
jgi:hypothetical protein